MVLEFDRHFSSVGRASHAESEGRWFNSSKCHFSKSTKSQVHHRHPCFKHAINIFTKPVIRNKPPIYKHNHIYVDLLVPQSADDCQALGSRTEWYSRRFKLSQIPHIQLGKMGDGAGSVNLLMAFPRMTHQHPYLSQWVSMVPGDVQNLLWDRVLIPAMQAVMPEAVHPYVGLDRAHLSFKEKNWKGAYKASSTFPF